jgi:hypothetical protein
MGILSKDEQKALAREADAYELHLDDKWYVVDITWYQKWLNFIGLDTTESSFASPGQVNNKAILDADGHLKEGITELTDYRLVPEKLWKFILQTYGIESSQVLSYSFFFLVVVFCKNMVFFNYIWLINRIQSKEK